MYAIFTLRMFQSYYKKFHVHQTYIEWLKMNRFTEKIVIQGVPKFATQNTKYNKKIFEELSKMVIHKFLFYTVIFGIIRV